MQTGRLESANTIVLPEPAAPDALNAVYRLNNSLILSVIKRCNGVFKTFEFRTARIFAVNFALGATFPNILRLSMSR